MQVAGLYVYTTQDKLEQIRGKGVIIPHQWSGRIWLSPTCYDDPQQAATDLALPYIPDYRIGPISPDVLSEKERASIRLVPPSYGKPGGGLELSTSRRIMIDHIYNFSSRTYEMLQIPMEIRILNAIPLAKERFVFIIGQDTTEVHRLRAIQSALGTDYRGLIAKDIEDLEVQTLEEKVELLGALCRFVICENSFPSGHIGELKICASNRFVTAILQEAGLGATWMQVDYPIDYSFMKIFSYKNLKNIGKSVQEAVKWAEDIIQKRQQVFNRLYPWRDNAVE